jgi:hypothetical protein
MNDPNPYQSPQDVDDGEASPASAAVVEGIAIEAVRSRGPLLFAAIACGFPGGLMLVSSLLLLTSRFEDRLFLALPGGVLVLITWFCTSLRAHISTLDRRRDETSTRSVVRAYGRLAMYVALVFLMMSVVVVLLLVALVI